MDVRYRIQGGVPLQGDVTISGSKNAALPIIAATILVKGETILRNVPRLSDVETMLSILRFLGAETAVEDTTIRINTASLVNAPIPHEFVSKLRGAIVLLGPLLSRFGRVEMSYPGGCVLGKRPVNAHLAAFIQMGVRDLSTDDSLCLEGHVIGGEVILPEFSVTATENVLIAAALAQGETRIHLAAAEPHVQDLCHFLQLLGVSIQGIGSHTLLIQGSPSINNQAEYTVVSDYLEAGCMIIAGLVTRGELRVHGAVREHLISFLGAIERMGGVVRFDQHGVIHVHGSRSSLRAIKLQTNIFPGFPTDLQAPIGIALTQAHGVSRVFEVLFEGRMAYLYELEKMGAHIEILNAHQSLIIGPTPLQGRTVASNDIRAGAAMVLAGLCGHGETVVTDVRYIERGYDRFECKLRSLGARIEREAEGNQVNAAPVVVSSVRGKKRTSVQQ